MQSQEVLSGKDFADGLVFKVSRDVYNNWGILQDQLANALGWYENPSDKLPEGYAPYVFVAAIVIDMQAIRNLRSEDEFLWLRKHVLNRLGDALGNEAVEELFDIYQTSFNLAVNRNEDPLTFGVASTVREALKITHAGDSNHASQSPRILLILSQFILSITGFTKFALENYEIVME